MKIVFHMYVDSGLMFALDPDTVRSPKGYCLYINKKIHFNLSMKEICSGNTFSFKENGEFESIEYAIAFFEKKCKINHCRNLIETIMDNSCILPTREVLIEELNKLLI